MEISELLKSSIFTNIELHISCLIVVTLLYIHMRKSFHRNSRKVDLSLQIVYICCALTLISDCIWTVVSSLWSVGNAVAYIINMVYFISSSFAAVCWFLFCINQLKTMSVPKPPFRITAMLIYDVILCMYILSPWLGVIFSIEDGKYIRGSLFYLDPIIKMGYIVFASVFAIICGFKKELGYLRKKDFNLALFGVPVLICGVLQTLTGEDFNCLGITLALAVIYITGITNLDSENTEAIYSLANSFEASYIVNMDTGVIRPLHPDTMHSKDMPGMESTDYTTHFKGVLSDILLPEDRDVTLETYNMANVAKRFKIDNSFNIRYRVMEKSGQTAIHTAAFIRASGNAGQQEFLLGINTVHSDSLLYERNKSLSNENQKLEQINAGIIESVAKIVEARDGGSGGHIVRVRKLTEIIAKELMTECPEYSLDEEKVKLISSASVLHDVGKIVIPDAILLKPGRLTDEEFQIMKTHSTKGCDILNFFPLGLDDAFLEYALSICRWHHEKYDGRGYPDGLKGEEIPIAAQIVSVADCFDALVSERPYKKAYSPEKAIEMIVNGECGVFSENIIRSLEKKKDRLSELARLYKDGK